MAPFTVWMMVPLLVIGSLWWTSMAASPAIGVAVAKGTFLVDNAPVSGNATLFQGAVVETGKVPSVLQIDDGTRLQLGPGSRGKVYRERLVLERGQGQIENAARYRIEAGSFRIQPSSAGASAWVTLARGGRVQAAALAGSLSVTTAGDVLVAKVNRGKTLEFDTQAAGAVAPFTLTGCLYRGDEHYLLNEETAGITFELKGPDVEKHVGLRVEISGTNLGGVQPAPGASQVIRVARLRRLSGACAPVPPAPAGAATPGRKATGAAKNRATKAIIAGIIVASAGAGAAVALREGQETAETISR